MDMPRFLSATSTYILGKSLLSQKISGRYFLEVVTFQNQNIFQYKIKSLKKENKWQ